MIDQKQQEYILERRHPYKYSSKPMYWYDQDSGSVILPHGNTLTVGSLSLIELLERVKRHCTRELPSAKSVTLFLRAGRIMKNRPARKWFDVSNDTWSQEKIFWNRLQAEYKHADGFKVHL